MTVKLSFYFLPFQGNGRIDEDEFVGILKSRTYFGANDSGKGVDAPIAVFKEKVNIWQKKISKIWGIINE